MNKKGFTLVELLAVIVILAIISIITIPLIGNVIEDSRKKALEQSVYGLVDAANYYAISNDGVHHFEFGSSDELVESPKEILSYKGELDAKGDLYIDNDGNISLCLMNENYYVYKNYNGEIYIGETKDDTCIVGYDAVTDKYIAMIDNGTGIISNVYSKEEVDNKINELSNNLQDQITTNANDINSAKESITSINEDLSKYVLKTELNETNNNMNSLLTSKTSEIDNLEEEADSLKGKVSDSYKAIVLQEEHYGTEYIFDLATYTATESGLYIITTYSYGYTWDKSGRFGALITINGRGAVQSQFPIYSSANYISEEIIWLAELNAGDVIGIGGYNSIPYNETHPDALVIMYQVSKI